ncbi:MAG TPA: Calx-beta domain-containing protein, partial [Pirellulales bacterium]
MRFSLFRQRIESRLKQDKTRRAKLRNPRLRLESLEERRLLAGDTSVSTAQLDVNHDGQVTPLDALLIIGDLNQNGARPVSDTTISGGGASADSASGLHSLALTAGGAAAASTANSSFDVNDDGYISPMDALLVIKQLNDVPAQVAFTMQATDLSGNPITQILQGQQFELRTYVQDVRSNPTTPGVFAAYTDVTFDGSLASVQNIYHTAAQDPNPNPPVYNYVNQLAGDFSTSGLLDEAGGFAGFVALGPTPQVVFVAQMTATSGGTLTFQADPADVQPAHAVDTFNPAVAVPTDQISYGSTTLQVVNLPSITAAPASVLEGNSGNSALTFNLSLSGDNNGPVTVHYSTTDGTAISTGPNADFQPVTDAVVTFPAHTQTAQITINVNGDQINENDETLSLNLFNATGATVGTSSVTGTILNDDAPPAVSVSDASVTEGTALSGTTPMTFNVSLSAPSSKTITVAYLVSPGTATFGNDYNGTSGVVTFLPGQISQSIVVNIVPDALNEANETLQVALSGPTNASLGEQSTATGTILDDDVQPSLSVSDASAVEPGTGTSDMTFTVTLSAPSGQTVTVNYATAGVTATSGQDFVPNSGTLTFLPGETSHTVTVEINADSESEQVETLNLLLSSQTNATIADGTGVGSISDFVGDKLVRIRLEATDLNGNPISSVLGGALFKLNAYVQDLRQPESSSSGVFAAYMDVDFDSSEFVGVGPITYGPDYQNVESGSINSGELDEIGATATSIPTPNGPGEHLLYSVIMQGVAAGSGSFIPNPAEADAHAVLLYGSGEPVPVGQVQYLGTSTIDVSAPSLINVNSQSITEGNSGQKNMTFTVTLSAPVTAPV